MTANYFLRVGNQPDSVVIDDGVAPFELTRDELKDCIAKLKADPYQFAIAEYVLLMKAYRDALAFLNAGQK